MPFFKDFRRCPKILDYTLIIVLKEDFLKKFKDPIWCLKTLKTPQGGIFFEELYQDFFGV